MLAYVIILTVFAVSSSDASATHRNVTEIRVKAEDADKNCKCAPTYKELNQNSSASYSMCGHEINKVFKNKDCFPNRLYRCANQDGDGKKFGEWRIVVRWKCAKETEFCAMDDAEDKWCTAGPQDMGAYCKGWRRHRICLDQDQKATSIKRFKNHFGIDADI